MNARPIDAMRQVRTLAAALVFVFAGAGLYANNIRAQLDARNPSVSHGSPTLAADAEAPRGAGELAQPSAYVPGAKVAIAWTSRREKSL